MTNSKRHIVILASEFPPLPGGIGNHAFNLSKHLQQSGYHVSLVADQRSNVEEESEFDAQLNYKVYRIKKEYPRFAMYIRRVLKTYRLLKSADFFICSGKFPLWVGALLKPFISARSIAVIHGSEVNFKNQKLRKSIHWSLKRFDKVIAVSNFTKDLVSHLALPDITVIPNGFSELIAVSKASLDLKGHPKLLTVGNVTERKGQLNVIKHLPKLQSLYPNVHYHCVGFKTEVEACKSLAMELQVQDAITFHGYVSDSKLAKYYSNSDICVMLSQETSTGDVEGFGIALIEANYYGLPTIGATGCGIEDAILEGTSGLLINAKNTDAFANAVTTILKHKKAFGEGAKNWANKHKWQHIVQRYISYFEA